MCSATFGDELWSTRGVGLQRVLAAIRVRSGATVKLVLESPAESKQKKQAATKQIQAREQAQQAAQAKKDQLLAELEQDEKRLKKGGKFFGLF
jgi:folate-dependent phosphoribosylglycinamide formyltransferase PurN